jgi:type I restriction enzyme S subunit
VSQASLIAIADFCATGSGGTPSRANRQYFGGEIPWVKSGELRESIILDTEEKITEIALRESSAKLVPSGSILLAMYGATVGRMALLGVDAATNQAVCSIRPDPAKADTQYLFHALQAKIDHFLSRAAGGAQPNISQGVIRETKILLPPLDQQRRIAAILDKADALRRKRKRALELLDGLTQSIFLEMFPPSRNSNYIDLGTAVTEFRYGTSNKSTDVGHPVLRIPNVVGGEIDLSDLKTVPLEAKEFARLQMKHGDLLLVRTNGNPEYVGRCAVMDDGVESVSGKPLGSFVFASYLIRARLDQSRFDPYFVQAYLSSRAGRKAMLERAKTSAGQFNVNTEGLASIPIPAADLDLQKRFSSALSALRISKLPLFRSQTVLDSAFSSLQHRAFNGQL